MMIGIVGGSGTVAVAAVLLAAAGMVVIMATQSQACTPDGAAGGAAAQQAKGSANTKAAAAKDSIPKNYLKWYKKVGKDQNIPWNVLAGIGKIETNHGRSLLPGVSSGENYAGAGGPMQFLKSSWRTYGSDGDGDGKKDRYNPADAILAASKHLRGRIGKSSPSIDLSKNDILKAVHLYNPGNYTPQKNPYARDVLGAANGYASKYKVAPANYAGTDTCTEDAGDADSGSFGQRIADTAAFYAEYKKGTPRPPKQKDTPKHNSPTPYAWGGGTVNGVSRGILHGAGTIGFDCSGLALHAVYRASKGQIVLPRTTHPMWASKKVTKVSGKRFAPGDLLFFNHIKHMGIYYGKVNGVRWMVEAQKTGTNVMFSKVDGRAGFVGAVRVKPPSGQGGKS